ncbi:MAG: hypothetical protein AAGM67_00430 [Bacteroidota bacterium]
MANGENSAWIKKRKFGHRDSTYYSKHPNLSQTEPICSAFYHPAAIQSQRISERGLELRDALKGIENDKGQQKKIAKKLEDLEAKFKNEEFAARKLQRISLALANFFHASCAGNLSLLKAVLRSFLARNDIRGLLPDEFQSFFGKDAAAAQGMLKALKAFLGLYKTKGSRDATTQNCHNAVATAVVTGDETEKRSLRKISRVSGISRRAVKLASLRRSDTAASWKLVERVTRSDKLPDWCLNLVDRWWHSEGSCEDNMHKNAVRIYSVTNPGEYSIHYRRYFIGNSQDCANLFYESQEYAEIKERLSLQLESRAIEAGRKLGSSSDRVFIGRQRLMKYKCPCIKKRGLTVCDCKVCNRVYLNLPTWHKRRRATHKGCGCNLKMTSSVDELEKAILCQRVEILSYQIPGISKPFCMPPRRCADGNCIKANIFNRKSESQCGWHQLQTCKADFGTEGLVRWWDYEPRLRS